MTEINYSTLTDLANSARYDLWRERLNEAAANGDPIALQKIQAPEFKTKSIPASDRLQDGYACYLENTA